MGRELLLYTAGSFLGAVGFSMLVRAPKRAWIPSGINAALVYLVYWLLPMTGLSEYTGVFCGALLGSLLGHLCARRMKMVNTIYLMSAIVPVVPGLGLYRMMASIGKGLMNQGVNQGVHAMIIIAMTALGLAMGNFLDRLIHANQDAGSKRGKEAG